MTRTRRRKPPLPRPNTEATLLDLHLIVHLLLKSVGLLDVAGGAIVDLDLIHQQIIQLPL